MCNIINMMPYYGCSQMLHISLKTENSFIAHPWRLLCVVGLIEEYSAHDWRAATSGAARSSYLARVGPVVAAIFKCNTLYLHLFLELLITRHVAVANPWRRDKYEPVNVVINIFASVIPWTDLKSGMACAQHQSKFSEPNPCDGRVWEATLTYLLYVFRDITERYLQLKISLIIWAPSQYKDRLIYVWRFPC